MYMIVNLLRKCGIMNQWNVKSLIFFKEFLDLY